MEVGGLRKIGKPKLRWSDVIRKDKEKQVKMRGGLTSDQVHLIWRQCQPERNTIKYNLSRATGTK